MEFVSVLDAIDTSTANGRLMMHLVASLSQWERETIGERTALALGHKRERLQAYSKTPYGYLRDGNSLVLEIGEQRVLGCIRDLRATGSSYAAIARHLNESAVPPRGVRWYPNSIRHLLTAKIHREVA